MNGKKAGKPAGKRDGYDDLDEMRKDIDELGEAMHVKPDGKNGGQARKPARGADEPKKKTGRGRKRIAAAGLLAALALSLPVRAADAGAEKRHAPADSLRALRVIISSEVKSGNEVMALEKPKVADSLLRILPSRESVLERFHDSSLARSIRNPDEFRAYWNRLEERNGIKTVKGRMAAQDVDKSLIPRAYLFDSSVVVYPGWIIVRRVRR
jgi:hypothetical protein